LGLALDPDGNLYIADVNFGLVQKVSAADGAITTVAGNGASGYTGDGGAAILAQVSGPSGMALDGAGNLYIADQKNNVIRKIDANGVITTFAGTGTQGYSGDGGPATEARLRSPGSVALDAAGNVFIGDGNYAVRKVTADGTIATVAGTGQYDYVGGTGDGGPATSAPLGASFRIALDSVGNLYIADGARLRMVGLDGMINTVAGTGKDGYSGDGGPAIDAQVNCTTVKVAPDGEIYLADIYNSVVRRISLDGVITTVIGNGNFGYGGDGGPATQAELRNPTDIAVDASGNIFITDQTNGVIRRVDANGTISTFSGTDPAPGFPEDGTDGRNALLFYPAGIAVDPSGNIYLADSGWNAVFEFQPDDGVAASRGAGR
jgi:sugar lactone lactonase YvrE